MLSLTDRSHRFLSIAVICVILFISGQGVCAAADTTTAQALTKLEDLQSKMEKLAALYGNDLTEDTTEAAASWKEQFKDLKTELKTLAALKSNVSSLQTVLETSPAAALQEKVKGNSDLKKALEALSTFKMLKNLLL